MADLEVLGEDMAGGEDVQDAGENALTAAHLRRRNEELQRERDARKEAA